MPKQKKRKRRLKKSAVFFILLLIAFACYGAYRFLIRPPEVAPDVSSAQVENESAGGDKTNAAGTDSNAKRKSNFYTFLICGTDDGNGGTDTIMVAGYDTKNQQMYVVSVPRDTLVDVDWTTKKINSTYNYGGVDLLKKELSRLMGFTVDFTVKVDLKGFRDIVDTVGGVDFNVPQDMRWPDPYINLKKGQQHLDGEHALMLVRMRHCYADQDIGRIGTQQEFLKALVKQTLRISNASKIPEMAKIFKEYVTTDLSTGNMIWFGKEALGLDTEDIHFATLPGDGSKKYEGKTYYVLDPEKSLEIINGTVNPFKADITLSQTHILTGD